jgi:hypothetical protein
MPNHKHFIVLMFTVFLSATLAIPVLAVTYTPGVTTGQYVKYGNFVVTGPGFEGLGDQDSLTLQVTNVVGSQVTLLSTGQFKNGTASPGNGTITVWDVVSGTEDGVPSTQGPIIAANLNVGNSIPPPDTYTINSTESRNYLGIARSVNLLSVIISTPDYNSSLTYVYDKVSGMLLESSSETSAQGESGPVTSLYSYIITQTNIFTPAPSVPETSFVVAAITAIVVALSVVLLTLRKKF